MFSTKIFPFSIFLLLLPITIVFQACTHSTIEPDVTDNNNFDTLTLENACDPDTVYFQNKVLPLIQSSCALSGCHNAASHREGIVLEDYNKIMKIVSSGSPSKSKLYKVLSASGEDAMPPSSSDRFSKEEKQLIYDWISQGALNNACESGCDTTAYTFTENIQPILNTYCAGCHGSTGGQSGVNMVGFINVILQVDNDKLLGVIKGKAGMPLMPPGNALPDCEITLIEKWVKAGAANN